MKLTQRLSYLSTFLIAIINFIYTLVFSSNWARGAARLGVFFEHAQEVNHLIFRLALYGVILVGLALLFNSHKNRKFYPANYVFSVLSAIMVMIIGVVTIIQVLPLKAEYLTLDPEQLAFVTTINWSKPGVSIFNWGIGISIGLLIAGGFVLFVTAYKFNKHVLRARKEKKHLEVYHEHS